MKFNSKDQERFYESAMKRDYKAAAFDVDGTLTEFAKFTIPDYLLATLEKIPLDVPLVLCTGRPLDFIKAKMDSICNATRNPEEQRRRWWIIAENGGAGYYYDPQSEGYVQFFSVDWPEEVDMDTMSAHMKDKLGWHIKTLERDQSLVVIYQKWMYLFPRFVRIESRRIWGRIRTLLKRRGWDTLLSAQNSGLGTLIIPKTSGKGRAIQRLARKLNVPMKQILCVGDNPQPGGNDEDFLSGQFGTPFTVGKVIKKNFPLPVLDERHVHLTGPQGTNELLKQVFKV